jgi:hypothetical protein
MAERKRDWMWRRLAEQGATLRRERKPRVVELRGDPTKRTVREHAPHPTTPALERFMALVERAEIDDDHCWRWLGGRTFRADDLTVTTPARFIYQAAMGETLRSDEALYQTCKTPRCVRPAHLEIRKSGHKNSL